MKIAAFGLALSLFASAALAAQPVTIVDPANGSAATVSGGALNVSGTFSASLGGFTPSASGARMTPLSVTTSDSSGNLPTGTVVVVSNVGTNPEYCNVNGVAATTSDELIPASSWFAFTIPAAITTLHCIATGGSTTSNGVGGAGLATGSGGGSGGGGGGAITAASGSYAAGAFSAGVAVSGSFLTGSIVDLTPLITAQGATTSGLKGPLVQCSVTTAAPTYTTAQTDPINCDPAGNVRVNVTSSSFIAATTTNGSSTIATGGTFQSALASSGTRKGCLILNPLTATETLFVFFGANGSATTASSIGLGPGSAVSCAIGGLGVATDNVSVEAATTSHAFVVMSQ